MAEQGKNAILDGWLDERELAAQLGVDARTLARWRAARTGPPYSRIGKKVVYRVERVLEWMESREVDHGRARRSRRRNFC